MDFGFTAVASITVICYMVAQILKITALDNKYIPLICGLMGGVLGVVSMFIMPDYPAADYITAAAVGIVSGLAATGANQILKQMNQSSNCKDQADSDDSN